MKFIRQEKSEKRIMLMLTNKRLVEAKRPRNSTHNATAFFSESSAIGKVDCGSPEQSNRSRSSPVSYNSPGGSGERENNHTSK